MSHFTIAVYHFFKKYPAVFYTLLIVSTLVFGYFGLQIKYEEDISKLLPSGNIGNSEQLVFNNLKVKDKIFVTLQNKDEEVNTDQLVEATNLFVDSLLEHDTEHRVYNVLYQIEEDWLFSGVEFLYQNMPIYLDPSIYNQFDSILSPKNLAQRMEENYSMLESATGMFGYELIQHDPAGLRYAMKESATDMGKSLGGTYKIIDQHFFTPDSTTALIFISPNFTGFDSKTGTYLAEQLEREIAQVQEEYPDVEIRFHGAPVQGVFNSRQIKTDLLMTLCVSLCLACIIIWICFKGKATLLWLLLPVGYGAIFALACLYWMQGMMSLMAIGIGAIVLGVALSYCLHIITHYKYVNDVEKVLREQTKPVILGSLTTIGAFMGLLFTDSALLKDFGLFASLALVGTTFFCLFFLPQFFSGKNNTHNEKAFTLLQKVNTYPFEKQNWLVVTLIVLACVLIYTSRWVTFDTDLKNIGHNDPNVVYSQHILADKTAHGNVQVYFAVIDEDLDSALCYNQAFNQHLNNLKGQGIVKSFSETSILSPSTEQQNAHIAAWKNYWTSAKQEQAKKAIIRAGEPYGFTEEVYEPFFTLISSDPQPAYLFTEEVLPECLSSNYLEYTDGNYLLFTPVQIDPAHYNSSITEIVKSPHSVVIDPFYYTQDMVRILTDNFNVILAISSIFVLIVLLISFKSISLALLAFMPMFLSWYMVQGIMGIFGVQFNLINIIVSSFIFGVGVDYSIFILDGLLASTREKSRLLMQHKTAIFLSAVVLIISISSLMFATHPAISSIGLTTLIGMSSTLLLAYTLEPFFFKQLMKLAFFQKIVAKRNKTFKPEKTA